MHFILIPRSKLSIQMSCRMPPTCLVLSFIVTLVFLLYYEVDVFSFKATNMPFLRARIKRKQSQPSSNLVENSVGADKQPGIEISK